MTLEGKTSNTPENDGTASIFLDDPFPFDGVKLDCSTKYTCLVTERLIQAGRMYAHRSGEFSRRHTLVATLPKQVKRLPNGF